MQDLSYKQYKVAFQLHINKEFFQIIYYIKGNSLYFINVSDQKAMNDFCNFCYNHNVTQDDLISFKEKSIASVEHIIHLHATNIEYINFNTLDIEDFKLLKLVSYSTLHKYDDYRKAYLNELTYKIRKSLIYRISRFMPSLFQNYIQDRIFKTLSKAIHNDIASVFIDHC